MKLDQITLIHSYDFIKIPEGFNLDLQRFASADAEGRTEKATEHKKRKAREEGRVALSKELPATVITLFCFVTIYFLGTYIFRTFRDSLIYVIENACTIDIAKDHVVEDLFVIPFLKIFSPIAAVVFFSGILSNYLQIGLKVTMKSIKPDFKKISPNVFKFLRNQVFSITGFYNLIKSMIKIGIIIWIAFITIYGQIEKLKEIIFVEDVLSTLIYISNLTFTFVIKVLLVLIFFSIIDIVFVRWQYEQTLKMKKEEVKEEYKELYGDPNVRSRLRQMYQSLLSQKRMLKEVPKADVVITNPTHYAVCLHYDKNIDEAPRVTAKGKDKFAQTIKAEAKKYNVFMYENVMLARTLYSEVEVNDVIPRAMYGLVINAYKLAMEHKRDEELVS